jgi:lambda repressor-like predicted transcriptional regulator
MNSIKRHERVKMKLRLVGSSLSAIARELGVAPTSVTAVSRGRRRSDRIEWAIAHKLNSTPAQLWPQTLQATKRPKRQTRP